METDNGNTGSSTTTKTTTSPVVTQPSQTTEILKLLEDVKEYSIDDINTLLQIARTHEQSKTNKKGGRCTTALTSLCFSVIEEFGLLLRTDLSTTAQYQNAVKNGNIENALIFFEYATNKNITNLNPSSLKAIYILYRNTITHSIFPNYGLGIAQNISNGIIQPIILIKSVVSLNINWLAHCVIEVVKSVEEDVKNNPSLLASINGNLINIRQAEIEVLKVSYQQQSSIYPTLQAELSQLLPNFTFTS